MQKNKQFISWIITTKPLLVLIAVWLIMQLILLFSFGIVTTNEATKYSGEAQQLLHTGHFSEMKYIFYSVYILLHVLFYQLGFETTGVYAIQLCLNLVAMYCFYKTILRKTGSNISAFIGTALLITCYSWQYWTVYLYTESVFCSLILIFSYLLFGIASTSFKRYAGIVLLLLLIMFSRPTGMYMLPVLGLTGLFVLIKARKWWLAALFSVASLVVFILLVSFAMQSGSSFDFMKPLLEHNVLCYIPYNSSETISNMPVAENNLLGIWHFFVQNPGTFFQLACLKALSFWGMTRTYYSTIHNAWLIGFFYPLYFFAGIGLRSLFKTAAVFAGYISCLLIVFTLSVMLTCDDWNNRFNMPIIPFVVLLAGIGLYTTFKTRLTLHKKLQ